MSASSSDFVRIATFVGGRTKRKYLLFWSQRDHFIYREVSGFFGSSKEKTDLYASSPSAAFHVAEMWAATR